MFFTVLWQKRQLDTGLKHLRKGNERRIERNRQVLAVGIAVVAILAIAMSMPLIGDAASGPSSSPVASAKSAEYSHNDLDVSRIEDIDLHGADSLFSHLSDDQENVVLFWSTWCPHCKPVVERLSASPRTSGRMFSIVEEPDADELTRYEGLLPILVDEEWSVFNQYGLEHVPSLFIVDNQGVVLASAEGEEACLELLDEFESH